MPHEPSYEVGYKKPPLHARFKKGQSGNPRARPKRSKDFAALLTEILNEKVTVTENGQPRQITKTGHQARPGAGGVSRGKRSKPPPTLAICSKDTPRPRCRSREHR
jgi:hypothetical protein